MAVSARCRTTGLLIEMNCAFAGSTNVASRPMTLPSNDDGPAAGTLQPLHGESLPGRCALTDHVKAVRTDGQAGRTFGGHHRVVGLHRVADLGHDRPAPGGWMPAVAGAGRGGPARGVSRCRRSPTGPWPVSGPRARDPVRLWCHSTRKVASLRPSALVIGSRRSR